MEKTKKGSKQERAAKKEHLEEHPDQDLCCCPPRAMVWIDTAVHCCFIENEIEMKRRLQVRADAVASLRPPGGPDTNAEGAGGSQLDEGTMKAQGKVYRTDSYTIHWQATAECRPILVSLDVGGEVKYRAGCIPESGSVTLSRSYMLEPPNYEPGGPGSVDAVVSVRDCSGQTARCRNSAPRP